MMYLHYKVIKLIGEGGMGKVYLAEDTLLEKKVALKVLSSELCREEQFIERFKREAKIQSKLSHQNIVTLHNLLKSDDTYFIVMEFAEGITLQELIRNTGLIPEIRALKIFDKILNALKYAHSKNVIHRDIKPSNIMISENDDVKIMDFGIAKLLGERTITRTNTKLGSLYYMSPEQLNNPNDVDYRTDLFSLGIVLFEMVTGKLPYDIDTDSDFKIMNQIINSNIPDPKLFYPYISEKTINLINLLTNKNRDLRIINFDVSKSADNLNDEKKDPQIKELINKDSHASTVVLNDKKVKSKWKTMFYISLIIIVVMSVVLNAFNLNVDLTNIFKNTFSLDNSKTDNSKTKFIHNALSDVDGRSYYAVLIGSHLWMAENLNVAHYRNGDIIPQVQDSVKWSNLSSGAWCYYTVDGKIVETFGKLYNWYAVNDSRGLAPFGWHIPSDAEWSSLTNYLGGDSVAGGKLKASSMWSRPNKGASNESGFTALPGGFRDGSGFCNLLDNDSYFWSVTALENENDFAWSRSINYDYENVNRFTCLKIAGLSVRCIKD